VVVVSANVVLVYLLAHRWLDTLAGARVASALYAFHWLPLGFGSTVYPRPTSTCCVLLGALLLSSRGKGPLRGCAAGGLLSLAFAMRYSEIVFALPMLVLGWVGSGEQRVRLGRCAGLLAGLAG